MTNRISRTPLRGAVALTCLLVAMIAVPAGAAASPANDLPITRGFRKAVTLAGIRQHQSAFQSFATANGGTRASGTPGFDASADYVVERMEAAGYDVTRQPFEFAFFEELATPELDQVSPTPTTYTHGVDFSTMDYSGSGDPTAELVAVDLNIPSTGGSTSGCEDADFTSSAIGRIVLVQRGTCTFGEKAVNAQEAGAIGVIIMNEGNDPGRSGLLLGTLGGPGVTIPVTGTTFALGNTLSNGVVSGLTGITMHMFTSTISEIRNTENIIAETSAGDADRTIVVGAHLDSVTAGPGINDNGSGSGTILEIAETYAAQDRVPRNRLRFMWYGAEENGLLGSEFYVGSLSQAELDQIELMLNFDMLGSPNYVRFVYDGNNSTFPAGTDGVQPGPPGSGAIEQIFLDYFKAMFGTASFLGSDPTPFNGRSDYGPFILEGIPAGGLFSGAEGSKTAAQVVNYGGTIDVAYDPCYHQACDTFAGTGGGTAPGLALRSLDQLSDGVAHTFLLLSRRNFDKNPLEDPVAVSAIRKAHGVMAPVELQAA